MAHPRLRWTENDLDLPPEARAHWIAILPLGAHEGHGPHLPLETDTLIAEGIAGRLMEVLPPHLPVTVLPAEPVGYSPEHLDVPGTRSLPYGEAIERWLAIAEDLCRFGIRKLVLLNAHGGNSPLMTIVATEARVRFNMLVVATAWTRFGQPEGWISPEDKAIDIHGGDIETSVMLALHPRASTWQRPNASAQGRRSLPPGSRIYAPMARMLSAGRCPTSMRKALRATPAPRPPKRAKN